MTTETEPLANSRRGLEKIGVWEFNNQNTKRQPGIVGEISPPPPLSNAASLKCKYGAKDLRPGCNKAVVNRVK